VSSCSAAAVSPCAPDQTGDIGLHRLNTVKLYITSCIKTTVLNLLWHKIVVICSANVSVSARTHVNLLSVHGYCVGFVYLLHLF